MRARALIEFTSPEKLAQAAVELRSCGYGGLDAHTPYSTEVVREALNLSPSVLPRIVFAAGLIGASAAYLLEWYINAYLYPLNVGGRPPHMPLAFVPISFEMGVLAAAFTAFCGVLVGGKLLRLWAPVFEVPGFESFSNDKFWLAVDASAPDFDAEALWRRVAPLEPTRCVLLEGK